MTRSGAWRAARGGFERRIQRIPKVFDAAAAERSVAPMALPASSAREVLAGAAGCAPFLARLMARDPVFAAACVCEAPEVLFEAVLAAVAASGATAAGAVGPSDADTAALAVSLRRARRQAALLIALCDLAGVWDLDQTTAALTDFADTALETALRHALALEASTGALPSLDPAQSGFFALAMGKMGAFELNYSSDIDLILLFDDTRLAAADRSNARLRFVRMAQRLVKLLSQIDAEGYVARVDLRLRPDPSATPIVLSTASAMRYYQSQARPWERAAHIKARVAAGDRAAGEAYLAQLTPFVWRRAVDFAAVEDTADMLAKIRAHEGGAAPVFRGHDLKLGAGGIREIEFLAQTRQLIAGGRDPALRAADTRSALRALRAAGRLEADAATTLDAAYVTLRDLEHRLQMIEDRQTHRAPTEPTALARLAGLCGLAPDDAGAAALEQSGLTALAAVRRVAAPEFAPPPSPAPAEPPVAAAFDDPAQVERLVEAWRAGRPRALRHVRARARMARLAPEILNRLAAAADPMQALRRFDGFLNGLPSGVRILSLFEAKTETLDLVCDICAAAPRLAQVLARRPTVLDAALDQGFFAPPAGLDALASDAVRCVEAAAPDYEAQLDVLRRWAAEKRFQTGVGVLQGRLDPMAAGQAFSDVAEAALRALWGPVLARCAAKMGAPPGRGAAVMALGRLGSREMTAGSDVDLIIVYDADAGETSTGPTPTPAPQYYARLTQLLTAAISAPTSEGRLYDVDMRLRPSGNAGPLATSLSAFRRYQREDAWTWERMALLRARVVAGAPAVVASVDAAVCETLASPRDPAETRADAVEMRARLDAANTAALDDPWSLKFVRGGLVDLDFIAQVLALNAGLGAGGLHAGACFDRLAALGALDRGQAATLRAAHGLMSALQQLLRVALEGDATSVRAGAALEARLVNIAGAHDWPAATALLSETQGQVRAAFHRLLAPERA